MAEPRPDPLLEKAIADAGKMLGPFVDATPVVYFDAAGIEIRVTGEPSAISLVKAVQFLRGLAIRP